LWNIDKAQFVGHGKAFYAGEVVRYQDFRLSKWRLVYPLMSLAQEKGSGFSDWKRWRCWLTGSFHRYVFLRPQDIFDRQVRDDRQLTGTRSACNYLSIEPYFEVRALATRASGCASCD
jgi:hypothetical protein